MRQCAEMAELGMELARAAQREALRDLEPPVKRRAPSLPGLPDFEHIPHRSEWWDHRDPAFGELFGKLCRCVRQAILLEARIAAGTLDRPAAPAPTSGPADRAGPAHQPTRARPAEDRPRPAEDRASLSPRAAGGRPRVGHEPPRRRYPRRHKPGTRPRRPAARPQSSPPPAGPSPGRGPGAGPIPKALAKPPTQAPPTQTRVAPTATRHSPLAPGRSSLDRPRRSLLPPLAGRAGVGALVGI